MKIATTLLCTFKILISFQNFISVSRWSGRFLQLPEPTEQAVEEISIRSKIRQLGSSKDAKTHPLYIKGGKF
jgi:hypothetical protein